MFLRGARRTLAPGLVAVVLCASAASPALAQPKPTGGFDTTLEPNAAGEELNSQSNLWACEVSFKSMRMIWVDITDPKTGKKNRELVWYLCYRCFNRPLGGKADESDTAPVNLDDPAPSGPMFVPEFELVTTDQGVQRITPDEVIPEAQQLILKREQRNSNGPNYKNSVGVIQEMPPAAPPGSSEEKPIWGIAMWRGIDPDADFYTVFMSGFSNGYKQVTGPDGQPMTLRRTVVQEYWRPGDRFDPREVEVRPKGDPVWQYRPDEPDAVTTTGEPILPGGVQSDEQPEPEA